MKIEIGDNLVGVLVMLLFVMLILGVILFAGCTRIAPLDLRPPLTVIEFAAPEQPGVAGYAPFQAVLFAKAEPERSTKSEFQVCVDFGDGGENVCNGDEPFTHVYAKPATYALTAKACYTAPPLKCSDETMLGITVIEPQSEQARCKKCTVDNLLVKVMLNSPDHFAGTRAYPAVIVCVKQQLDKLFLILSADGDVAHVGDFDQFLAVKGQLETQVGCHEIGFIVNRYGDGQGWLRVYGEAAAGPDSEEWTLEQPIDAN